MRSFSLYAIMSTFSDLLYRLFNCLVSHNIYIWHFKNFILALNHIFNSGRINFFIHLSIICLKKFQQQNEESESEMRGEDVLRVKWSHSPPPRQGGSNESLDFSLVRYITKIEIEITKIIVLLALGAGRVSFQYSHCHSISYTIFNTFVEFEIDPLLVISAHLPIYTVVSDRLGGCGEWIALEIWRYAMATVD